jgi:hypothetical protein
MLKMKILAVCGVLVLVAGAGVALMRKTFGQEIPYAKEATVSVSGMDEIVINVNTGGHLKITPSIGNVMNINVHGTVPKSALNILSFSAGQEGNQAVVNTTLGFSIAALASFKIGAPDLYVDISLPQKDYSKLNIASGSTQVNLNSITQGNILVHGGSGQVIVEGNMLAQSTNISTGSGSVVVQLTQPVTDLQYNVKSGSGKVNFLNLNPHHNKKLNGSIGGGNKQLQIATGSGGITVSDGQK